MDILDNLTQSNSTKNRQNQIKKEKQMKFSPSLFSIPESSEVTNQKRNSRTKTQIKQFLEPPKMNFAPNEDNFSIRNSSNFQTTNKSIQRQNRPSLGALCDEEIDKPFSVEKRRRTVNNSEEKAEIERQKGEIQDLKRRFDCEKEKKQKYQREVESLKQNMKEFKCNLAKEKKQFEMKIVQKYEEQRIKQKQIFSQQLSKKEEIYKWKEKQLVDSFQMKIKTLQQSLGFYEQIIKKNVQISNKEEVNSSVNKADIVKKEEYLNMKQRQLNRKYDELLQEQRDFSNQMRHEKQILWRKQEKWHQEKMERQRKLKEQFRQIEQNLKRKEQVFDRKMEKLHEKQNQLSLASTKIKKQGQMHENFNQDLVTKYKGQLQYIHEKKRHVFELQSQLLQKIRVVDLMIHKQNKGNSEQVIGLNRRGNTEKKSLKNSSQSPKSRKEFENLMMNFTKKKLYEKCNDSTNLDAFLLSISKRKTKQSRFHDLNEFYH